MTTGGGALLVLQGIVFLAWAAVAFRLLFRLRARAAARSGVLFPGPRAALAEMRRFATAPGDRAERRLFVVLTGAIVLLTALQVVLR